MSNEHWSQRTWRPALAFAVSFYILSLGGILLVSYTAAALTGTRVELLKELPGLITASAAFMAVITPVIGVAAWWRGKQKLEKPDESGN